MFFALNKDGERVQATKTGQRAFCTLCGEEMISHCGLQVANHWKHKSKTYCNSNKETKSEWHYTWQYLFGKDNMEIVVNVGDKKKIADVKLPGGLVIEFQYSSITAREILSREKHYEKIAWVFDASGPVAADRFIYDESTFDWEHPRRSITSCNGLLFLDVGNGQVFQVDYWEKEYYRLKKWHDHKTLFLLGKGTLLNRLEFKSKMIKLDSEIGQSQGIKASEPQKVNNIQRSLWDH